MQSMDRRPRSTITANVGGLPPACIAPSSDGDSFRSGTRRPSLWSLGGACEPGPEGPCLSLPLPSTSMHPPGDPSIRLEPVRPWAVHFVGLFMPSGLPSPPTSPFLFTVHSSHPETGMPLRQWQALRNARVSHCKDPRMCIITWGHTSCHRYWKVVILLKRRPPPCDGRGALCAEGHSPHTHPGSSLLPSSGTPHATQGLSAFASASSAFSGQLHLSCHLLEVCLVPCSKTHMAAVPQATCLPVLPTSAVSASFRSGFSIRSSALSDRVCVPTTLMPPMSTRGDPSVINFSGGHP